MLINCISTQYLSFLEIFIYEYLYRYLLIFTDLFILHNMNKYFDIFFFLNCSRFNQY